MIVDSSAVLAVVREEAEQPEFERMMEQAEVCRISAANYLESAIVLDAVRDAIVSRRFDDWLRAAEIIIEPVTAEQAKIAREAYRDFGKGSGHPAQLNFGDCFAYALAKTSGEPLLFKGRDFLHTDIESAV
jgi:ribonuclease VapC